MLEGDMCHSRKEEIEEKKVDQEYKSIKNWVICTIDKT